MMSKIKNLPHRRWDTLRELWIPHVPQIDLGREYPGPTSWYFPGVSQLTAVIKDSDEYENIIGLRECVFREAVIFARKHLYCKSMAVISSANGHPTWSTILSYEACYFGARSLLCLLGIINIGRHSKFYLDIFGEREERQKGKKHLLYDMNIVHHLESHLTHDMVWKLCTRMRDTLKTGELPQECATTLRGLDFGQVSNLRNNLMYDAAAWQQIDDYSHCDLALRIGSLEVISAITNPTETTLEGNEYFSMAHAFRYILYELFSSIAELAPGIASESEALKDWSIGLAA